MIFSMNPDDPLIGRQLANFRVERLLARGGMGRVYYGWDVKLQRPVAIKVIDARYQDDQSYARRFVQEAQAIATWDNPNIFGSTATIRMACTTMSWNTCPA
jgi:serine/threonine-protein kinase